MMNLCKFSAMMSFYGFCPKFGHSGPFSKLLLLSVQSLEADFRFATAPGNDVVE